MPLLQRSWYHSLKLSVLKLYQLRMLGEGPEGFIRADEDYQAGLKSKTCSQRQRQPELDGDRHREVFIVQRIEPHSLSPAGEGKKALEAQMKAARQELHKAEATMSTMLVLMANLAESPIMQSSPHAGNLLTIPLNEEDQETNAAWKSPEIFLDAVKVSNIVPQRRPARFCAA